MGNLGYFLQNLYKEEGGGTGYQEESLTSSEAHLTARGPVLVAASGDHLSGAWLALLLPRAGQIHRQLLLLLLIPHNRDFSPAEAAYKSCSAGTACRLRTYCSNCRVSKCEPIRTCGHVLTRLAARGEQQLRV